MPIPSTSTVQSNDYYYSDDFKTLVRSHKDNIINNSGRAAIIDQSVLYAFGNDFYRFLRSNQVDPRYWWATSFINGWNKPDFNISKIDGWIRINEDYLSDLISRSNSIRS